MRWNVIRKFLSILVSVLWLMVLGCSNQTEHDDADVGDSSPLFEGMISMVLSDGIERFCEYVGPLEDAQKFPCVHTVTREIYICTREEHDEGVLTFHCEAVAEGETVWTSCEEYRWAGDGKSGRSCWAPPLDYCRYGCGDVVTWFCKDDASTCCMHGCNCFGCDWIEVSIEDNKPHCQRADENKAQPDNECESFFVKLPAQYQDCIQGNCDESTVTEMAGSADCKNNRPDFNLLICE